MKPFVAVESWFLFSTLERGSARVDPRIKRDALMFDCIVLNDADYRWLNVFGNSQLLGELEWLEEQGIVRRHDLSHLFRQEYRPHSQEHSYWVERFRNAPDDIPREFKTPEGIDAVEVSFDPLFAKQEMLSRLTAIELRENEHLDAYPLVRFWRTQSHDFPGRNTDVIEIVLQELPFPEVGTPWENIIEFREDPDSRRKFTALRAWMSEIARMKLERNDVEVKLKALINDYERHMNIHRIKTRLESLKTIVIAEAGFITSGWLTGLGALPGIAGMLISPLYSIKQRTVVLLEEEQRAPGKEVAYVSKANQTFE